MAEPPKTTIDKLGDHFDDLMGIEDKGFGPQQLAEKRRKEELQKMQVALLQKERERQAKSDLGIVEQNVPAPVEKAPVQKGFEVKKLDPNLYEVPLAMGSLRVSLSGGHDVGGEAKDFACFAEAELFENAATGTLRVVVSKGKDLYNPELVFSKQDPYVKIKIGKDTEQTQYIHNGGGNPEWGKELQFKLEGTIEEKAVIIEVFDHNPIAKDAFIGSAKIPIRNFLEEYSKAPKWIRIGRDANGATDAGFIELQTELKQLDFKLRTLEAKQATLPDDVNTHNPSWKKVFVFDDVRVDSFVKVSIYQNRALRSPSFHGQVTIDVRKFIKDNFFSDEKLFRHKLQAREKSENDDIVTGTIDVDLRFLTETEPAGMTPSLIGKK